MKFTPPFDTMLAHMVQRGIFDRATPAQMKRSISAELYADGKLSEQTLAQLAAWAVLPPNPKVNEGTFEWCQRAASDDGARLHLQHTVVMRNPARTSLPGHTWACIATDGFRVHAAPVKDSWIEKAKRKLEIDDFEVIGVKPDGLEPFKLETGYPSIERVWPKPDELMERREVKLSECGWHQWVGDGKPRTTIEFHKGNRPVDARFVWGLMLRSPDRERIYVSPNRDPKGASVWETESCPNGRAILMPCEVS